MLTGMALALPKHLEVNSLSLRGQSAQKVLFWRIKFWMNCPFKMDRNVSIEVLLQLVDIFIALKLCL